MPALRVRRAELADKNAVFSLAQLFTTGREPITRDEFTVAFETMLQERETQTAVLFVAEEDGAVVGYSLLSVSRLLHAAGLSAHLHELVVSPEVRGHGVGESLVTANEQYCGQRGVAQISASTGRFGTFYNHLGFEVVGEHYRKLINRW